ncbi:RHS repeat-associated core domain-containing protein [Clostridium felsineum]|uniref:Uncharacterized protein n=1 Tax=Clostridium felsineum TaxID=36839 RepID=A0A1S8L256_9CLOT|nr:hypothetical protein CLROS_006230 [Clostridium felsineum]URZ10340.1 hypothetical protein CROST_010480 [Clostridium felsineum]
MVSYTYDSFGKLIAIDGSLKDTVGQINPYRYKSYRYDSETGLYYLQSRYYNPEWGRFINADSITANQGELLSGNMFAYCENNPVNKADVDGNIGIIMDGDQTVFIVPAGIGGVSKFSAYEAPKKPASKQSSSKRSSGRSKSNSVRFVDSYRGGKIITGVGAAADSGVGVGISKGVAKLTKPIDYLFSTPTIAKVGGGISKVGAFNFFITGYYTYQDATHGSLRDRVVNGALDVIGAAVGIVIMGATAEIWAPGLAGIAAATIVSIIVSEGISLGEDGLKYINKKMEE